jgi:eukaryotic-like serine/threonine-protein kinase
MRMVGEVIGDRYELEELVGSGGMSSVFRAHDRLLERKVALKVLHEQYTRDEDYVERFRREARSVASLSHPNIVTVIDRGEHEGRQYIVFEYVDGENLKHRIDREGALPVRDAVELVLQIGRALQFAHQNGLVHRDVKPQNVLLNGDGRPKITDFGIARSLDVQRGMTQTGAVLGTSDYIAPEQAQGEHVDDKTDMYSLGVVLYELLSGETPFTGENFVAVAMQHINNPPPNIQDRRGDVSPRLAYAIDRALAKDPGDRWASMAEFCNELERCLAELDDLDGRWPDSGATMVVTPSRARRTRAKHPARSRRLWPWLLALLVLAAVGAAVAYLVLEGSPAGQIGGSGDGAGKPVKLTGVAAYDPVGDRSEHDDDAALAADGNPATRWTTQTYNVAGELAKPGVGVVLRLPRAQQLSLVRVSTDTPGFQARIQVGDSQAGNFEDASNTRTVNGVTSFPIRDGVKGRYVVVWITRLPSGSHVAHVNEVQAVTG